MKDHCAKDHARFCRPPVQRFFLRSSPVLESRFSSCSPAECRRNKLPCGRYFVSAKIRPVYRHGTFCSRDHRARASANAVTKARRLSGKEILIDAAARWLRERDCVSTWQSDPAVKRRLASFLSTKTLKNPNIRGGRAPVTAKWTTRNRIAIQKRTRSAHREVTVRLTGARNSQTKKGGGGQSEQGLFGA